VIRAARRDARQTRTIRLTMSAHARLHALATREQLTLSETIERYLADGTVALAPHTTPPPTAKNPPKPQAHSLARHTPDVPRSSLVRRGPLLSRPRRGYATSPSKAAGKTFPSCASATLRLMPRTHAICTGGIQRSPLTGRKSLASLRRNGTSADGIAPGGAARLVHHVCRVSRSTAWLIPGRERSTSTTPRTSWA
jgi:hypothetical protein